MKPFDPGRMRHLATFNAKTRVPDGAGGYTEGPTAAVATLTDVPIELTPASDSERMRAMQVGVDVTHRVRTWYSALITADMTITVDGVTYEITSAPTSPDNLNELTTFTVAKRAAVV
jgi:SPP1 family predicted phage head-tail adaptor